MIDVSLLSPSERIAASKELTMNMRGHGSAIDFMQRIAGSKKTNGNSEVVTPGLEGMGLAKNRSRGNPITLKSLKIRKKVLELQDMDNSYGVSRYDIRTLDNIVDAMEEISTNLVPAWSDTIHAGIVEYMTANAGQWGVLDPGTDILGADGLGTFNAAKYDGALNNTFAQTGTTIANITDDFWNLFNQLKKAKIPGTDRFFWGSASLKDLDITILFPTELNEVIHQVFGAEMFLTTSGGVTYNSPSTNMLAKEGFIGKPSLIPSSYLSEISTTAWYVFFSAKNAAPGTQAFSLFFNPDYSTSQNDNKTSKDITFGNFDKTQKTGGDFFNLQYLGEGSDSWVKEDLAVITSKTSLAIFCGQPYRCGRIA